MSAQIIWKWTWPEGKGIATFSMPVGARVLSAREQIGSIALWAICDPNAPKMEREFALCGTGHAAPEHANFIDTVFVNGGELVFHIFELTAPLSPGSRDEQAPRTARAELPN